MSFAESLTIRILGDSSGLARELELTEQALEGLQQQVTALAQGGERIGQSFAKLEAATTPLQQLSGLLSRVLQQTQNLSQQSISLNVQPALNSLMQLSAAIAGVSAQLRTLSLGNAAPRLPALAPAAPGMPGLDRVGRPYATGGLVSGPPGIDRVPARLSAGEFVLNRDTVSALGLPLLEVLNRQPTALTATPSPARQHSGPAAQHMIRSAESTRNWNQQETHQQTINHIGGIHVQIQQVADWQQVLDQFQQHQPFIRNRRG
jgi:hypothetical protein